MMGTLKQAAEMTDMRLIKRCRFRAARQPIVYYQNEESLFESRPHTASSRPGSTALRVSSG